MSFFAFVLSFKIAGTALLIALPFLVLSTDRLNALTGAEGGPVLFRLYGVSFLALLVGYAFGFAELAQGRFPFAVAVMGLVSNAGAAAVMIALHAWRRSLPAFILVTSAALGLTTCLIFPNWAISPLL